MIVDVVIPFQTRPELLRRCIESVRKAKVRTQYEVIVIDDGSTGTDSARALNDLVQAHRIQVLEQPARRGFAAAVNRGFDLHRDRDVVVLHSDAEVANDWLDRLVAQAGAREVGVVATFTNSVGIATYPLPGVANALPEGHSIASLDALFARANEGTSHELPFVEGPALSGHPAVAEPDVQHLVLGHRRHAGSPFGHPQPHALLPLVVDRQPVLPGGGVRERDDLHAVERIHRVKCGRRAAGSVSN